MQRLKKTAAFVLALVLVIGTMYVNTYAASFLDTNGHWAQAAIERLADQGVVSGWEGKFYPDAQVTRAEFCTMVNIAMGFTREAEISYSDVGSGDWFYSQVKRAVAAGYISGYEDNTIRPNANITRNEAAVILSRMLSLPAASGAADKFVDASNIPAWAKQYVDSVINVDLMTGYLDNTFGPSRNETKAEAANQIAKAMARTPIYTPTPQSSIGDLTLSESYGSANGNRVIEGTVTVIANGITLQNVTIKADLVIDATSGNGTVYLNNVNVEGKVYIVNGKSVSFFGTAAEVEYGVKNGYFTLKSGDIGRFHVTKDAESSRINLEQGASVDYMIVDAKCALTGRGQILQALINVTGVTVDIGLIKSFVSGSRTVQYATSGSTGGYYNSSGIYVPTPNPDVPSTFYTVTFNANGGVPTPSAQIVGLGHKVVEPEPPIRSNYLFAGWYNDSLLTSIYNFNTPVTKDITLYAKWTSAIPSGGLPEFSEKVEYDANVLGLGASLVEVTVKSEIADIVDSVIVYGEPADKVSGNLYRYVGDPINDPSTIYNNISINLKAILDIGSTNVSYNSSFGTHAYISLTGGLGGNSSITVTVGGIQAAYIPGDARYTADIGKDRPTGAVTLVIQYNGVTVVDNYKLTVIDL